MFEKKNYTKFKKKAAIITSENEVIDYETLFKLSDKFVNQIKKRELVFLVCGNNVESIIGYVSFLRSNSVISLIDEKINFKHLISQINIYKPKFIFIKKNKNPFLEYKLFFKFKSFYLYKRKINLNINLNKNLQLLISTSGSTGSSKLVKLSKQNLISNTKSIVKYLKLKNKDTCITTLPMSYVYGLSLINTHIFSRGTIILNEKSVLDKHFWNLIEVHNVTNFGGVPYTYQILDKINFYNKNLKSIKFITQAGGKLDISLNKKIIEKFCRDSKKLIVMYGATEATARMSYVPDRFSKKKIGSIGIPIPGGKFWIEDKKGKIIKKNYVKGELIYSGKNVFMGYSKKLADLSTGDENHGILRTGDLAYKDKDNFFYIYGRIHRDVKVFGNRVNLVDIENNILKLGIKAICKLTKENNITIFITKHDEEKILKNNISSLTNLHPSVFKIKIIEKFPMNKNLKISYNHELLK